VISVNELGRAGTEKVERQSSEMNQGPEKAAANGAPDLTQPSALAQQSRKLNELIQQAEHVSDPGARALLHECLRCVLEFYGDGLGRILQIVRQAESNDRSVFDRLINDSVVRGLLLIHGLHPQDLSARLMGAMEKVRPYMQSHGGSVELLGLDNDVARFRLVGACKTCSSSSITLELALRRAIEEACPDLAGFEVEGVQSPP